MKCEKCGYAYVKAKGKKVRDTTGSIKLGTWKCLQYRTEKGYKCQKCGAEYEVYN